jgi:hypothetical protein
MAVSEQTMQASCAPVAQAGAKMAAVWRYVITETCITVVINLAIGAVLTWKLGDPAALAHAGFADTAHQLMMPTLGPASGMALGITNLTRGRVARGLAPRLHLPGLAWLPRNLLLRSAVISLAALVLLGGSGALAMVAYIQAAPLTFTRLMEFMLAYAAVSAAILTPCIILPALADKNRDIT